MLKVWLKIDGEIQVRSALHGLHVCQGLIKIGKSGSLSSFLFAFVLARSCLLGWLVVYPPSSHAEVRLGNRLGKSWSFSSSTFRRPTNALPQSGDFKAACSRGQECFSSIFECLSFSYTNVSCQICRCQRNFNTHIVDSALTCSILAMVTFSMLQLYYCNIL
jgi:hypothetical protein